MHLLDRLHDLATAMAEAGLDLVVALTDGRPRFLAPDPVYVLSGVQPKGPGFATLSAAGEALLYVQAGAERGLPSTPPFTLTVHEDLPVAFSAVVSSAPRRRRTGFVGLDALPRPWTERAQAILGAPPTEVDALFHAVTGRRTEEELAALRGATAIAEAVFLELAAHVQPGRREYEVAAELDYAAKARGAEDLFLLLAASQHPRAIRPPGGRLLARGDILLLELSPAYQGQYTQLCRTVALGIRPGLEEAYRLLVTAYRAALGVGAAGRPAGHVAAAVDDVLTAHGFGAFCRPPYMRARGHGLGMGPTAPGDLTRDNDVPLAADMAFVLHPNQYLPGVGYLMCGNPVRVAGDALESLATEDPALVVL